MVYQPYTNAVEYKTFIPDNRVTLDVAGGDQLRRSRPGWLELWRRQQELPGAVNSSARRSGSYAQVRFKHNVGNPYCGIGSIQST